MNPQRVLVVVRSLRMGGMEKVAVTLCDALAAEGHEVHLLSFKKERSTLRPADARVHLHVVDFDLIARLTGIGLIYDIVVRWLLNLVIRKSLPYWRGIYASFFFERFLRRLEQKAGRFDRIIVRGQGTFEYLWRVRDPRMLLFLENAMTVKGRPAFTLRAFYSHKDVVCVSTGVRESFESAARDLGIEPRSIHVLPNPIPIEQIRAQALEPAAGLPREPYIVNVARLVPQKNHPLLFAAFHLARIPHKLVIVGSGSEEKQLQALVREMGIADRVLFTGMQPNPFPWMKHADLFVLSSRREGFGLVLAEALACGTPVVAVECAGGIRDVLIEEAADYIAQPTPEALAQMIEHALANPLPVKAAWVDRFEARSVARRILELPAPPGELALVRSGV